MASVLFLEDETSIREVLSEYMTIAGYEVFPAATGSEAMELIEKESFVLAVLDIMVPDVDGLTVLDAIRAKDRDIGVIVLTALDDERTELDAFNRYADDFCSKPISPLILLKRMESLRRRVSALANAERSAPPKKGLFLEKDSFRLLYDGEALPLTLTEFLLMEALMERPGKVFTREELILRIFNEDYVGNDRIIDAHVKNLRKKIPGPSVRTVIGIGYQFDGSADEQ